MENRYEKLALVNLLFENCANQYIESLMYINNTDKYSDKEKTELSKDKLKAYLKERRDLVQELANMDILELKKFAGLS